MPKAKRQKIDSVRAATGVLQCDQASIERLFEFGLSLIVYIIIVKVFLSFDRFFGLVLVGQTMTLLTLPES